jgi:hypothetical protein
MDEDDQRRGAKTRKRDGERNAKGEHIGNEHRGNSFLMSLMAVNVCEATSRQAVGR